MKYQCLLALGFLGAWSSAKAGFSIVDPSYSASVFHTHSSPHSIVSFDWGADNSLVYMTSTESYQFGGLYLSNGPTLTNVVMASSDYAGASVSSSGNFFYYNTSYIAQEIHRYGPVTGLASDTVVSSANNWGLLAYNGGLFVTGADGLGRITFFTVPSQAVVY